MRLQFALPEGDGKLTVSVNPGIRSSDQKPVLIMELTARGTARSEGSDREKWFAATHDFIVQAFDGLTSEEAHKEWGLRS